MPSTRELRRRIRSVKNTAQITKAMQMVAATKMRRAQLQTLAGRPYLQALKTSLARLLENKTLTHPLMQPNSAENEVVLFLSTDKSLCGALNTNLVRFTENQVQDKTTKFYTVGKKVRHYIVKTAKILEADFENKDLVTFAESSQIARIFINGYLKGELKQVSIIYPHFVSTLTQEPKLVKILPVDLTLESPQEENSADFLIEPDPQELINYLLVHFIETSVYQTMLETKASEHSARMISMQNATDNAKELASDLNLTYNQTRQAAITNELLEITSATAALE